MQGRSRAQDAEQTSYFSPVTVRRLWQLVNTPQPVDGAAVRAICLLLVTFYLISCIVRFDPQHLAPLIGQSVAILSLLFGALVGPRFDWPTLRVYTVAMALLLPGTTAVNITVRGTTSADVLLVAAATFAPMITLQTGADVLIAIALLSAGGMISLPTEPFGAPRSATGIALGTAMMAGAVTALSRIAHQARVTESMISLERALRGRSELVNTMSHELRSPLNVIIGYADMLATEGGEQGKFMASRIRVNAVELLQLVENTLSAARLGSGKVAVHPSRFALDDLVSELRESTQALQAQPGVSVRWQLPSGLPPVRIDRLKLKEIILNLVSNALKCTQAGSVTIRIQCDGKWLLVNVEDTGVGIPAKGLERIFDMFERFEPRHDTHTSGVGLGLYIVKTLVELMGGEVTVSSEVGRGSCFAVRLPCESR